MLIKTFGFVGNADYLPSFVRVELRVERGFMFRLSGVTSSAAKALQARVRSALLTCGYRWPGKAITVNIAPATTARSTTELDLPIALSILAALGKIPKSSIKGTAFSGELSLDGTIRYTTSSASPPSKLKRSELSQIKYIFSSTKSQIKNLSNLIGVLSKFPNEDFYKTRFNMPNGPISPENNNQTTTRTPVATSLTSTSSTSSTSSLTTQIHPDKTFLNLVGETNAKRKALIAAAGGHHIILIGPPGSGKSTLAQIIHSLLPDIEKGSSTLRPQWLAPHSITKPAGLIGSWRQSGGSDGSIKLGELSLAHQGILFMDEWAEFFSRCP